MGLFLAALGLMMVFEGIPFFCFPETFKKWASTIHEIPNGPLRILGLVIIIIGLGLAYFGRSLTNS